MPDTSSAKILRFPARSEPALSAVQAQRESREYFALLGVVGAAGRREELLDKPDVLFSVCSLLRELIDSSALMVCQEAVALYRAIGARLNPLGSFDERDYFLGETAFLAAMASRTLGKRSDVELWLDRAEAGFRHTVNPSPLLANVTYERLALRCETGRYDEVVELAPMLAASFGKLNMRREHGKCLFLEGVALKQSGHHEAAAGKFESLNDGSLAELDPGLVGLALVNLADIHASDGKHDLAEAACGMALPLMRRAKLPAALAHLNSVIGESLRRQGRSAESIKAYQASVDGYETLGMRTYVAYLRVLLAQTLIEAGKPREAEWQILAALPIIDEEKMVPEGFAAVALLRESVRQRKMDPLALRELREHLQVKN